MKTPINIKGLRYGRLTVLNYTHSNNDKKACWDCVCDCGGKLNVPGKSLRYGYTKSCGCINKERFSVLNRSHGYCVGGKSKTYHVWRAMIGRCELPTNKDYKHYGGRGISVCPEWRHSFSQFITDMGQCPDGYTLDRIDVNKGYTKDNCRWATWFTQNTNKRKSKLILT